VSKKVLGRGLDALIPRAVIENVNADKVVQIPVGAIEANPQQPRKRFDKSQIRSLSESIKVDGVLQPVVVRQNGEQYELVMGERRLQAARVAGMSTVPAIVRTVKDADSLRLALVENLQRVDLNPIEVAEAYRSLIDTFGLSQNELAGMVGKERSSVANTLRLLSLPEEVRALIVEDKLSEGHARALLALPTESEQLAFAKRIQDERMTVRQVENQAVGNKKRKAPAERTEKPTHIKYLEEAISRHLGTRVVVDEKRGGKGRLVIEFYSHEEFERLAAQMNIPLPR
jgi:ParB family chromosome partitioning protein